MDPRRFLSLAPLSLMLGGFALPRPLPADLVQVQSHPLILVPSPTPEMAVVELLPIEAASDTAETPSYTPASTARPYLLEASRELADHDGLSRLVLTGRPAIAAANRSARATSSADAFVGGVQRFAWREGRVYEVWTAPLRVTTLTLAPGETVTAKAAGDTVRWQIGESASGMGAQARTHVLIKPLQSGLETNLVLTTSQRVYLLALRSGDVDAFNAAIAWDDGLEPQPAADPDPVPDAAPIDLSVATPHGPIDARYRIEPRGRSPRWSPTAVFNDGIRTFIALSPAAAIDEAPALFVRADGELQLANYRQAEGVLVVDRVFDEAELRLGGRRPQIVRIRRMEPAAR